MAQTFKNPLAQSQDLQKVPPYNRQATYDWLSNYGDDITDDVYRRWATSQGKPLKGIQGPHSITYRDQYLQDEDWLQHVWNEAHPDILRYLNEKGDK